MRTDELSALIGVPIRIVRHLPEKPRRPKLRLLPEPAARPALSPAAVTMLEETG